MFAASPNTSTMRSENPLTTSGWSPKPSAELTMPSTLTTRLTRSSCLARCDLCQHDEASCRAALSPALPSTVSSLPSLPLPTHAGLRCCRQEQELAALYRVHELALERHPAAM